MFQNGIWSRNFCSCLMQMMIVTSVWLNGFTIVVNKTICFFQLATILKQIRGSEEANQAYLKAFVNDVVNLGSQRQTWVKRKV